MSPLIQSEPPIHHHSSKYCIYSNFSVSQLFGRPKFIIFLFHSNITYHHCCCFLKICNEGHPVKVVKLIGSLKNSTQYCKRIVYNVKPFTEKCTLLLSFYLDVRLRMCRMSLKQDSCFHSAEGRNVALCLKSELSMLTSTCPYTSYM